MILVETTVVIDFLRSPSGRLLKIIQDNQAAICGVTLAEVYAVPAHRQISVVLMPP